MRMIHNLGPLEKCVLVSHERTRCKHSTYYLRKQITLHPESHHNNHVSSDCLHPSLSVLTNNTSVNHLTNADESFKLPVNRRMLNELNLLQQDALISHKRRFEHIIVHQI
jgi:hypothetical protein